MNTSEAVKNELKAFLEMQKNLTALVRDKKDFIAFGTTYQYCFGKDFNAAQLLALFRLVRGMDRHYLFLLLFLWPASWQDA